MIQEYFKTINFANEKQQKTRPKIQKNDFLHCVFTILCCLTLTQAVNVQETFPFCDGHLNSQYININNFCGDKVQFIQQEENSVRHINVLNKLSNPVSGIEVMKKEY